MPTIDADDCGRGVPYPPAARKKGIAGHVSLRVSLDEQGRSRLSRWCPGYGLDEAAMHALRTSARCRFTALLADDGQPLAHFIPAYTFCFELPQ